jgi:hypothetical protein
MRCLIKTSTMFQGHAPKNERQLVNSLSAIVDLSIGTIYEMIKPDFQAFGISEYKPSVKKLCEFLGENPEDLFGLPDGVRQSKRNIEKVQDVFIESDSDRAYLLIAELRKIDRRSATIIILRFGLDGHPAHTLEEIGHIFHVTRERIRQIEARALRLLRRIQSNIEAGDDEPVVYEMPQPVQVTPIRPRNRSFAEIKARIEEGRRRLESLGIAV